MLPHLASRLFGTPLLIHPPKLDVILSVVGPRMSLATVSDMPPMDMAAFQRSALAAAPEGIAVIPIHGSLVKRALGMDVGWQQPRDLLNVERILERRIRIDIACCLQRKSKGERLSLSVG